MDFPASHERALAERLGAQERLAVLMALVTEAFVANIRHFITACGLDLLAFGKSEDKDAIAYRYLADFPGKEGVLFAGRAREKAWCSTPRSALGS